MVSPEAKDLVKKMLTFDHKKRPSAGEVLKHSWFERKAVTKVDEKHMAKALTNLKNFRAEQKLQKATLAFLVSQLSSKDEIKKLQKAFRNLDKNGDGLLSREELLEGYTQMLGDVGLAQTEVESIMEKVDSDGNGFIDYSEFVTGCVDLKKLLSARQLEYAFSQFDEVGGGQPHSRRTAVAPFPSTNSGRCSAWAATPTSLSPCGKTSSARSTKTQTAKFLFQSLKE